MTLEEICEVLKYSPSTIKSNFRRTQEYLKKEGILLTKDRLGYYYERINTGRSSDCGRSNVAATTGATTVTDEGRE